MRIKDRKQLMSSFAYVNSAGRDCLIQHGGNFEYNTWLIEETN